MLSRKMGLKECLSTLVVTCVYSHQLEQPWAWMKKNSKPRVWSQLVFLTRVVLVIQQWKVSRWPVIRQLSKRHRSAGIVGDKTTVNVTHVNKCV